MKKQTPYEDPEKLNNDSKANYNHLASIAQPRAVMCGQQEPIELAMVGTTVPPVCISLY
jgi:hypothetical protein